MAQRATREEIFAASLIVIKENSPSLGPNINRYLSEDEETLLAMLHVDMESEWRHTATAAPNEEEEDGEDDSCK